MKTMEKTQKLLTIKQVGSSTSKEIKRRRRRDFEKIHIPNEIIEEIMVKLPVKSLIRFQTVSKHWRSLIRSKDFRERHMALEQSKECKLLLVYNDFEDYVSFKTVALERTSASVVDEKALECEVLKWMFIISQSCDGLVCLYDSNNAVKVINPATRMFIQLPLSRIQQLCIHIDDPVQDPNPVSYPVQDPNPVPHPKLSCSQFGFGKDSITRRYKLVWLYNTFPSTTTTCEVFDLEEKKTWRFVNTNTLDHHNILNNDQGPVFVNGSLYWLTGDEYGYPTQNTKLIVFDIHTEMFRVVQTPPFINSDTYGHDIGLCNLHGRLCISVLSRDKQEFWWRVKDNTWESIFSAHLPSAYTLFRPHFRCPLTPLAICRDTNKVILGLRSIDNLVALDLNPPSTDYHLYFSGFDRLPVPYFPSLSLSFY